MEPVRVIFNQAISAEYAKGNEGNGAKLEIAREYFTNPEFKKKLEIFVWAANT